MSKFDLMHDALKPARTPEGFPVTQADFDSLRRRHAEAIDALKRFAALLQDHNDRHYAGSDSTPVFAINSAEITIGDLRRIRALIAAELAASEDEQG
jgi:hypothetical protein